MAGFVKVGGTWVNADKILGIQQTRDGGQIVVQYGNDLSASVSADDGKALLAWASANNLLDKLLDKPEPKSKSRIENLRGS